MIHARCCHCLATSAAFTAKAVARPTAQTSGGGRRRPLVVKPRGIQSEQPAMKTEMNNVFFKIRMTHLIHQILVTAKYVGTPRVDGSVPNISNDQYSANNKSIRN